MDWKQKALYTKMSDISEDHYCAGWMNGNEFTLWRMVSDPTQDRYYGMAPVEESDIEDLRQISAETGGWIYWHDDEVEPGLSSEEWGPRFIPMPQWLEMYAKQVKIWKELRAKYATAAP